MGLFHLNSIADAPEEQAAGKISFLI